ncbi:hypothetical protein FNH22_21805 [Fulvivirga sp. M361]|uniref:hypothetical protein n=1 Tax=Fulvivirga sp. M361 TaxID=2594266 RepID=UPI001179A855|nr:hypothetical protein [Fulvivirga sp. M361]TRX52352.1 hypothetical protein FNH22_21805 [Fulvivirga sp. M361]
MRKILISLFAITLMFACDDDDPQATPTLMDGTYEGTFIRSSPNAKYKPSEVTLTFTDGKFTGDSEIEKYPAICNGTYDVKENSIEFSNSCVWTAEFDWSYILSGEFETEVSGDELILKRTNGNTTDTYQLKRK